MSDAPDPLVQKLVNDPLNCTGIWNEFAAACRAAGHDDYATIAEKWIAGDDQARGQMLAELVDTKWGVANLIAKRFLLLAGPVIQVPLMEMVKKQLAGYDFATREMAVLLAASGKDGNQRPAN